MKKSTLLFFVCSCLLFFLVSSAVGYELEVYTENDPIQDDWSINGWVHEIGCQAAFPPCQQIDCVGYKTTEYIPCPSEYQGGTNVEVEIRNLCDVTRCGLIYVSDPETFLTNIDEWVGQVGDPVPEEAFWIDHRGENQPLVFESMTWDNCFEPGETWRFVIQEYVNTSGGPPHALDSLGIASMSTGWPPSTGSIITPEPATICLLGRGALALLRRRKK